MFLMICLFRKLKKNQVKATCCISLPYLFWRIWSRRDHLTYPLPKLIELFTGCAELKNAEHFPVKKVETR